MTFRYQTSDCMPRLYPVMTFRRCFITAGEKPEQLSIKRGNYQESQWGEGTAPVIVEKKEHAAPARLQLQWMAVTETRAYTLDQQLDTARIEKLLGKKALEDVPLYRTLVVGIAPYGRVALWLRGTLKSKLIGWFQAQPMAPELLAELIAPLTPEEYCAACLAQDEAVAANLQEAGLPQPDYYDRLMRQYRYRYLPLEEYWDGEQWQRYDEEDLYYDDMTFRRIEVQRFDGSHQQRGDLKLLQYHKAGLPRRLTMEWLEGTANMQVFCWFSFEPLSQQMEQLRAIAPDVTPTLVMRLDSRAKRFELALQGGPLEQPATLPQECYEMLVFRNGNEYWRSEIFTKEDEAEWEWD